MSPGRPASLTAELTTAPAGLPLAGAGLPPAGAALPPAGPDERVQALLLTLQHVDQGILMVDTTGRIVVHNQRVVEMLGLPAGLLDSGPSFLDLLDYQWSTEEFSRTAETLRECVRAGGIAAIPPCYERERPNGVTLEVRTQLLPGGAMVRTFTDITARKRAQALAERAATVDELTGLPTRLAIQQRLEAWQAAPAAESIELLFLSLDRFRLLNDARGYEVGDRVLVEVARRLTEGCGPEAIVGRVGGDDFAVLHRHRTAPQDGEPSLCQRLLRLVAAPVMIDGDRLAITASIGAVMAEPGVPAATLLRNADVALNRAKDAGRNQVSRYTPSMTAARQDRFRLEQALRGAIGTSAFRLAYQPIMSVERGDVIGFEALLRWTDPQCGEVSPAVFVPIAEATGSIVPLGRLALQWACDEAARWPAERSVAGDRLTAQLLGDDIVAAVTDTLARSGLAPNRLELEVTEGMLLANSQDTLDTLTALRRLGVRLTLDDFGTGHAGLSYLRRFPFEKMKIDGSFVRMLGRDRQSDAIVEAVLLLGRRLEMAVVAEGVETAEQFERLRAMQCPFVQGYLTGRPMPPEQVREL